MSWLIVTGTLGIMPTSARVLALVGPTASGKTDLAVSVARDLAARGIPVEVVNADSMLVYRGMDIGTAKPTPAERQGVVHHLVDIWDVTHSATVADFQRLARAAVSECHEREVLPILVGGSALYIRAIVDDFEFPGTDPDVRAKWETALERHGAPALHAMLAEQSAEAAEEILPGNGRRIVRALEVLELTGRWQPTLPRWEYALPGVQQIGLTLPREEMDRRIEVRVDRMWAAGFVDEVRGLLPRGIEDGRTASRALGYRQVLAFLRGECTEAEARQATITGTRRFARKQLSWFKRDHRISWVTAGETGPGPEQLTRDIVELFLRGLD